MRTRALWPAFFFPICGACGGDKGDSGGYEISEVEDPGTSLDSDTDTGADTGQDSGDDTGQDSGDDTGQDTGQDTGPTTDRRTFGMLQVVSVLADNPIGSDTAPQTTTSWVLVAWERVDLDVAWTETLCGLEASEVFGTATSFPDAFVASMPVHTRSGTLSEATTGATLSTAAFTDLVGLDLEDPEHDALPTSETDPRVVDQDADGAPGVTVHVDQSILGEGDAYVIQRNTTTYEGVVVDTDRVEGFLDVGTEQVILSASTWWLELDTAPPIPDPDNSYFVLQQMDDSATCADLLDQKDSLF